MQSRERISAAAWMVIQDAHVTEDIFQNTVFKAVTKDVEFEAEAGLLSWAFITARREGLDWIRKHRRVSISIDSEVLALLEQACRDYCGRCGPPEEYKSRRYICREVASS